MLGTVLIVDQIATNRIALKAKLGAAQFTVIQAKSIREATRHIAQAAPDLILTADCLPDGSATDFLVALDTAALRVRPPILIMCESGAPGRAAALLRAGADDVVIRPVGDQLFMARIRSLVRTATADCAWQLQDDTSRALGFAEAAPSFARNSRVQVIGSKDVNAQNISLALKAVLPNIQITVGSANDVRPEGTMLDAYVLVTTDSDSGAMMRLMSAILCNAKANGAAIFVLQSHPNEALAAQALDMGATDVRALTITTEEIGVRMDLMLRRKSRSDHIRQMVLTGAEASLSDPLTGLHNRRYALPHLQRMIERAQVSRRPLAVMVADLDHFKRINDSFGHDAGDAVLVETAERMRENLRAVDMIARFGGEEFLVAMPGVSVTQAKSAAERLCAAIREAPFVLPNDRDGVTVSASIGLTVFDPTEAADGQPRAPAAHELIGFADKALYAAKERGRNRVKFTLTAA